MRARTLVLDPPARAALVVPDLAVFHQQVKYAAVCRGAEAEVAGEHLRAVDVDVFGRPLDGLLRAANAAPGPRSHLFCGDVAALD